MERELQIDPYAYMGVSKDVSKAQLKEAYRQKVLTMHPDKTRGQQTDLQFIQLNASYRYIKQRLELKQKHVKELEQTGRLNATQMDALIRKRTTMQTKSQMDVQKPEKVDWTKQVFDTGIVGDNFNADDAYREMAKYRTQSTDYNSLRDEVCVPTKVKVSSSFDRHILNEAFEKTRNRELSRDLIPFQNLSAWNDEQAGGLSCASIVEDGERMFVNSNMDFGTIGVMKGYLMIEDTISNFTDENDITAKLSDVDSVVTERDLRSYEAMRASAAMQNNPQSNVSFKESLRNMDYTALDDQYETRRKNADIIDQITSKLSKHMQAKLNAHMTIGY